MAQYAGTISSYNATQEIGKGGEGYVYELANNPAQVLKVYFEELSLAKIAKLQLMVLMANPQIDAYSAWPKDIVKDQQGKYCGFVMRKLSGYVPLHNLFSPMDRKRMFPDKGYNFLVHVARNLATAFYTLHAAGLVVGDINEGNILVNAQGMVAFIDCDSFQVKDGSHYHLCEVGVPRYTPPELLVNTSFETVVRTINTDSFSMVILIFQLLFLGRHPYAGKNNSAGDIDEEKAIKNNWFAYSLQNNNGKLLPPADSFPIKSLPEDLVALFHQSFEQIENRPLPAKWVTGLDSFLKMMVNCAVSPIHIYPSAFSICPWCAFKEKRNILYFIDASYAPITEDTADVHDFINGFKVEKLSFPKIKLANPSPNALTPLPIQPKYSQYKKYHQLTLVAGVVTIFSIITASGWGYLFYALVPVVGLLLNKFLPWNGRIADELERRKRYHEDFKRQLAVITQSYNQPLELNIYKEASARIERLIGSYTNLPTELLERQKDAEEKVYQDQLNEYLSNYPINSNDIQALGTGRKAALEEASITTAADIAKLKAIKVPGIGSKFIKQLQDWQRHIGYGFVYHPGNNLLLKENRAVILEMAEQKKQLEADIIKLYQEINTLKTNITNKQAQLKTNINILHRQCLQAELDYKTFRKLIA